MPDSDPPLDPIEDLIQAYRATGRTGYLLRACDDLRALLDVTPRSWFRNHLHSQFSRVLRDLAEATSDRAPLEEAIAQGRAATGDDADDDPWRYVYLNNLAQALGDRFDRTSELAHLDESEQTYREALKAAPEADVHGLATIRSGLATMLTHRFDRTGAPDDLAAAIDLCRPTAAMGEPRSAHELASLLGAWFDLSGDPAVLGEAIAAAGHAVHVTAEPGLRVMASRLSANCTPGRRSPSSGRTHWPRPRRSSPKRFGSPRATTSATRAGSPHSRTPGTSSSGATASERCWKR